MSGFLMGITQGMRDEVHGGRQGQCLRERIFNSLI